MLYVSRYDYDLIEITDSETGSIEVMNRWDCYTKYYKNSLFSQVEIKGVVPICGLYFYSATSGNAYIRALSESDLVGVRELERKYKVDCARRKLLGLSNKFNVAIVDNNLCILTYSDGADCYIPSYVNVVEKGCFKLSADIVKHIIKVPNNIKIIGSSFCDYYRQLEQIIFEGDLHLLGNDVFGDCPHLSSIVFHGDIDYISEYCFKRFNNHGYCVIKMREEVYKKHKRAFDSFGAAILKLSFCKVLFIFSNIILYIVVDKIIGGALC